MPTMPRKVSLTGVYHVMLRGNNKEKVFIDDLDIRKFLWILGDLKKELNFDIFAYCFMVNHVHLLLREPECGLISKFMQRLECRYVRWHNIKYDRCGHLFQNRFKSEPVESVGYFKTLVRYIHNNPVKAGMCDRAGDYADSSYKYYMADNCADAAIDGAEMMNEWGDRVRVNTDEFASLIDREYVFEVLPPADFERFHDNCPAELAAEESKCIDLSESRVPRVIDEYAFEVMRTLSNCYDGADLLGMGMGKVFEVIRAFRKRGLTFRQIGLFLLKGQSTVRTWVAKAA